MTVDAELPGITGTDIDVYLTDSGVVMMPNDLTTAMIKATTASMVYPGTGMANGTFLVPLVPPDTEYTETGIIGTMTTKARTLTLGFTNLGRVDQAPATMPTTVSISATGMDAWTTGDYIEVYSSNADAVTAFTDADFTAGPMAGATALTATTVDWTATGSGLIKASKGDSALVEQFHQQTSGSTNYFALTKSFTVSNLEMTDGQPATITGTFAAGTAQSDTFDWKGSQFAAHFAETHADTSAVTTIDEMVQPFAGTHGFTGGGADLLQLTPPTADATIGPLAYTNPVLGGPDVVGVFGVFGSRHYTLAGTTASARLPVNIQGVALRATLVAGPVQPIVTPPLMLEADGTDVTTDTTLGSATPMLSWSAPGVGTPTLYRVQFQELTGSTGTPTTITPMKNLFTIDTQLAVPANLLQSGHHYVVKVTARASTANDFSRAPNLFALPYGTADVASGILTVP